MRGIVSFFKWLSRSWFVIVPVGLAILHYVVCKRSDIDFSEVNKIISLVLQIIGGCLVLYSIDSDIEFTDKKSLLTVFKSWVRSCPLYKRASILPVDSMGHGMRITGNNKLIKGISPGNGVNEQIKYLQQQIDKIKEDANDEARRVNALINKTHQNLSEDIEIIRKSVGLVEHKISEMAGSGLKLQVFGVLIMIHGAIAGYYTG